MVVPYRQSGTTGGSACSPQPMPGPHPSPPTGVSYAMFSIFRSNTTPNESWFEEADRKVDYTPDLVNLEQFENQRIFVYDEMMRGHRKDHLLQGSFKCMAFTTDRFTLWKKKLGDYSFPIASRVQYSSTPFTRIKGEVHLIAPRSFLDLDTHKENGYTFRRKRIKVDIPYTVRKWENGNTIDEKSSIQVEAWMYIGINRYWAEQYDGGYFFEPVRSFPPKNLDTKREYYYFTKMEYQEAQHFVGKTYFKPSKEAILAAKGELPK